MIALAEELSGKNTRTGQSPEDAEEVYEHYLVNYSNSRISLGTESSDHQVIQE
jgi:hypothetical protein